MARKLSRIARHGYYLIAVAAGSALAPPVEAQIEVQVSSPTKVVKNPFAEPVTPSSEEPAAPEVPGEPEPPRRQPTTYRNPFAAMPLTPPTAPPSRPGPRSRWQRADLLSSEPSPLRAAILSANDSESGQAPWDLSNRGDALGSVQLALPPDPIQFAPRPLSQPAWLIAEASSARPLSSKDGPALTGPVTADVFELPPAATAVASNSPADIECLTGDELKTRSQPVDADWLPVVVSDFVDSPEKCYEQARKAADTAQTVDQFSTMIDICHRGLGCGPSPDSALALRRLAAWAYNRRGELRSEAREQQDALADFQSAARLDPNCWTAIHNRGVTLAEQGQSSAALRDFNRVLELNPGFAIGCRNRAELLSSLGRMSEAVSDYTRALDQVEDDAALFRARAYAWQRLGEFDRALDDLNTSLSLMPDQPDAYTQRGNLSAELGEFERAIGNYEQALRIDPNWGEAHRSLAWLRATCPDPRYRDAKLAMEAAQTAVQLLPEDDSFALDALAAAHANAGQFDDAVQVQGQAVATAPQDAVEPMRQRLALYRERRPYRGALPSAVQPASHTTPPMKRKATLR